jgi:hypothetical protein
MTPYFAFGRWVALRLDLTRSLKDVTMVLWYSGLTI